MDKKRNIYWDIVKGLGIIAIVLGHTGSPYTSFVYLYHLTLFFFISGYLYKDSYSDDIFRYIGKKIRDLYIPLVKYLVAFIVLHNMFLNLNIYSNVSRESSVTQSDYYSLVEIFIRCVNATLNLNFSETMAGAMWFIQALFVAMIIYCIIRHSAIKLKLEKNRKEFYTGFVCILLGVLGFVFIRNKVQLTWRMDVAMFVMPIIYFGYLYSLYYQRIKLKWVIAVISLLICLYFYKNYLPVNLSSSVIPDPIRFGIVTFSGIYLNLYVANLLMRFQHISRFVAYLGRKSFHIMALHFLCFKIINYIDVIIHHRPLYTIGMFPISNTDWWFIYLLTGILVPLLWVYLWDCGMNLRKKEV